MDFRYLEYFVEIAKENNITRAANNLYVSQSAVNQYLLKLEKELGTQLFVRSPRNWHLTDAGRIYLEGCREALRIKQDTYRRIEDAVESHSGTLTVGLTPIRGLKMFTSIYPAIHSKYPGLTVTPIEMDAKSQQAAAANGEIDLGFMILPEVSAEKQTYIDMGTEEIVMLVPSQHPACRDYSDNKKQAESSSLPVIDPDMVSDMPFALTRTGSTFRTMCDSIFSAAGIEPSILMETSTTFHIAQITETGQCCGLLPYYYAETGNPHYKCFALPSHPTWHLYIAHRKNAYLSRAARDFIRLSTEYWSKIPLRPRSM